MSLAQDMVVSARACLYVLLSSHIWGENSAF